LRGAALERAPGAVGALLRPDPQRGVLGLVLAADAEKLAQQQVLGVHGHVGLELALPVARRVLGGEQAAAPALHGAACVGDRIGLAKRVTHARLLSRDPNPASAACAAERPLRTAPSIVAGQPVSVHAPARYRLGTRVSVRARSD